MKKRTKFPLNEFCNRYGYINCRELESPSPACYCCDALPLLCLCEDWTDLRGIGAQHWFLVSVLVKCLIQTREKFDNLCELKIHIPDLTKIPPMSFFPFSTPTTTPFETPASLLLSFLTLSPLFLSLCFCYWLTAGPTICLLPWVQLFISQPLWKLRVMWPETLT